LEIHDLKQTFTKFAQQYTAEDTNKGQVHILNNLSQHSTNMKTPWSSSHVFVEL